MTVKFPNIALSTLVVAMVISVIINHIGFYVLCSFYPHYPSFVLSERFMTIGYALWTGLVESLPIGMFTAAYLHGANSPRNDDASVQKRDASSGEVGLHRSIRFAILAFLSMTVSDLISVYAILEIEQSRMFTTETLSLMRGVRGLYYQRPALQMINLVCMLMGFSIYDRIFTKA